MGIESGKSLLISTGSIRHVQHYHTLFLSTIDTTVKTGVAMYAPTWDIVMAVKSGEISHEEYEKEYLGLLDSRVQHVGVVAFLKPLEERIMPLTADICNNLQDQEIEPAWDYSDHVYANADQYQHVVLLCYCDEYEFCHRHLLKRYLQNIFQNLGWSV